MATALATLVPGGALGGVTPGVIALLLARELGVAAIPIVAAMVLLAAAAFLVSWSRRRSAAGLRRSQA